MFSPADKYRLTGDLFAFINKNPMCTRGELNSAFKTNGNDKRVEELSDCLNSLHALDYVRRHTDYSTCVVVFWVSTYYSGLDPDVIPESASENVLDPFGAPPALQPKPNPEPTVTAAAAGVKVQDEEVQATEEDSAETYDYKAVSNHLKGSAGRLYKVLVDNPSSLLGKNDLRFCAVVEESHKRALTLGKLWAYAPARVRRAVDLRDTSIVFYTLTGDFPESLKEQIHDRSNTPSAKRRADKEAREEAAAEELRQRVQAQVTQEEDEKKRGEIPDSVVSQTLDKMLDKISIPKEDSPEEDEEGQEDHEDDAEDEDQDSSEDVQPRAFADEQARFMFVLSSGETLEFNDSESAALRELILNLNINRIQEIQTKWKQSDSQ